MEPDFTNYSKDEVFALIDCAEGIFDTLLAETISDLYQISSRKIN